MKAFRHGRCFIRPNFETKEIRSVIRSAGKIPAQRSTTYRILRVYDNEKEGELESLLDKTDATQFGSYHEAYQTRPVQI